MDEVLAEFIVETNQYVELLDAISRASESSDKETLENIFRANAYHQGRMWFCRIAGA